MAANAGEAPFIEDFPERAAACPRTCGMTRAQVEGVAERRAASSWPRPGANWIASFAAARGGTVRPEPTANLVLAAAYDRFLLFSADPWRIAVGLGHVALHLPHVEPVGGTLEVPATVTPTGPLARARQEAEWFAACFLMPETVATDAWMRHSGSLRAVSSEFRVSAVAAAARLIRLGLR